MKDKSTMRHGSGNNRRQRGRNNNGRRNNGNNAPNRSQVFDSNGPEVRIRGTAHQIVEKYAALAKDSTSLGDYTLAENYLQHAEHYQRIVAQWDEQDRERAEKRQQQEEGRQSQNHNHNHNQKKSETSQHQKNDSPEDSTVKSTEPEAIEVTDLGLPASLLVKAPLSEDEKTSREQETV